MQNLTLSIQKKSILWLEIDKNNKLNDIELKNQLNSDLQLLYLLSDEIESINPWIANYSQLASI